MPQLLVEMLRSRAATAASSWASQAVLATSKGAHQEDEGSGVRFLSAGVKFHRRGKKRGAYYLSDDTFPTSWILKFPFYKTLQAKLVKEDGFPLKLWSR